MLSRISLAIVSLMAFGFGCTPKETPLKDLIPGNATEKFYWSSADISGKHFDKSAMYLPIGLDTVTKKLYAQFDLGSDATVLYQTNLKSVADYKYLKLDSLTDAGPNRPLFVIKAVDVNLGKIHLGKRDVLGFYNYGNPLTQAKNSPVSENSIGTVGADVVQNKVLVINFPDQTISILDSASSLENYFSFVTCKLENNRIMVPVSINGKTLFFMYDTGSSLFPMMTAVSHWKDITEQNVQDTMSVTNFGNPVMMLGSRCSKNSKIGSSSLSDFDVYYARDNNFDKLFEQLKCDGIIGNAFFFNKVICVDFKAKRFGISK